MNKLLEEIKKKIKAYSINQISITDYCKEKMGERNIDENLLITTLFSGEIYYVEKQKASFKGQPEIRWKLIFKVSSRYSLIIITLFEQKVLKVLNVIKTSKDVEKWHKRMLK